MGLYVLPVAISILKQRCCDHPRKALRRALLSIFSPGGKARVVDLRQFIGRSRGLSRLYKRQMIGQA